MADRQQMGKKKVTEVGARIKPGYLLLLFLPTWQASNVDPNLISNRIKAFQIPLSKYKEIQISYSKAKLGGITETG